MKALPTRKLKKQIVMPTVMLIGALLFAGILKLGISHSSDILYEFVKRETGGYYTLSFKALDINLWERSITLDNVLLNPDSTKDFSSRGLNNLYKIQVASLIIDIKSTSSIYLRKELVMENMRIVDPQISIVRSTDAPSESFSLQTGNLYSEISNYLEVLRINNFQIDNGEMEHHPSEFALGNIDFIIQNLVMDSTSRPHERFFSENIELEILNQSFKLKDSIHQVSFDQFLLSTTDSVLNFKNLTIAPISQLHKERAPENGFVVYDIAIPQLKLAGFDYFSAYQNNQLNVAEMLITNPKIFIKDEVVNDLPDSIKGNSLLGQLVEVFDEVHIGKLGFVNATLDLENSTDYSNSYQHVKSARTDIVLYNINLDTINYHFDHRGTYFDNVEVAIKNYSSYLPDSIHTVHFDLLELSSFDSTLIFEDFRITHNGSFDESETALNLDIPLLKLKGIKYLDALVQGNLVVNRLELQRPMFNFKRKSVRQRHTSEVTPSTIFDTVKDYFNMIDLSNIEVTEGSVTVAPQLNIKRIDLNLYNLHLDDRSFFWDEVVGDLEFTTRGITLQNKAFSAQGEMLRANNVTNQVALEDWTIQYQDEEQFIDGKIEHLKVKGAQLDSLASGNYLAFDSLLLNEPTLKMKLNALSATEDRNLTFSNKYVQILNGQMEAVFHDSLSVKISDINTSLTYNGTALIHNAQLNHVELAYPQVGHRLNFDNLIMENSEDMRLQNLEIKCTNEAIALRGCLHGAIPSLQFHGINQFAFQNDNRFFSDSLDIQVSDLDLKLNNNEIKKEPVSSFEMELGKVMISIEKANFSNENQKAFKTIGASGISILLEQFDYPENPIHDAKHFAYSNNLKLKVKELHPTMTNHDSINVQNLTFSTSDQILSLDSIAYIKADRSASVQLPNVKSVGLNLDLLINQQHVEIDSILLAEPVISVTIPSKSNNISANLNTPEWIKIDYLSSFGSEFELKDSNGEVSYALHEGEVEVRNFFSEGKFSVNQFFDYSEVISIRGADLSLPLSDGYTLNIDQYHFNHPQNVLNLEHVSYTSEFSPDEYSTMLTSQNDWFNIAVDRVGFEGLNLRRFISRNQFSADKISLEQLEASIYRDKSVPFPEDQVRGLPQDMLRSIDAWIYIDTIHVVGNVSYHEKPANMEQIGQLSFNDLDMWLFDVTSVDSMVRVPMRLESKGKIMNAGDLEIAVSFDMLDRENSFTFAGEVRDLPLSSLNRMLEPIANVTIKNGHCVNMAFDIKANNQVADGEMKFRYNNLKIQFLNAQTHDTRGLSQNIKTFFANSFVLKKRNPNLLLRDGSVFYPRDTSRGVFHYWGKALLSGAISSVGINKNNKAQKQYNKVNNDK